MTTQLELPLAGALPSSASALEYLTIAEAAQRVCAAASERSVARSTPGRCAPAGFAASAGSRGGFRIRPADLDAWLFDDAT
jgi:hypothetical protein